MLVGCMDLPLQIISEYLANEHEKDYNDKYTGGRNREMQAQARYK